MQYNTQRERLIMPEYGRHVQSMIQQAITLENREERNRVANSIIDVMGQLKPELRDMADYKHKLWDHLFFISDFKLDVDSPYTIPSPDTLVVKPEKLHYPSNHIKFKHYGKNIELIIEEIKKIDDEERRNYLIANVANFLKMAYLNWNLDAVEDNQIIGDLKTLSGGELKLEDSSKLNASQNLMIKKQVQRPLTSRTGNSGNGRYNKNRKRSN
jgi:hypothetical protein